MSRRHVSANATKTETPAAAAAGRSATCTSSEAARDSTLPPRPNNEHVSEARKVRLGPPYLPCPPKHTADPSAVRSPARSVRAAADFSAAAAKWTFLFRRAA